MWRDDSKQNKQASKDFKASCLHMVHTYDTYIGYMHVELFDFLGKTKHWAFDLWTSEPLALRMYCLCIMYVVHMYYVCSTYVLRM